MPLDGTPVDAPAGDRADGRFVLRGSGSRLVTPPRGSKLLGSDPIEDVAAEFVAGRDEGVVEVDI